MYKNNSCYYNSFVQDSCQIAIKIVNSVIHIDPFTPAQKKSMLSELCNHRHNPSVSKQLSQKLADATKRIILKNKTYRKIKDRFKADVVFAAAGITLTNYHAVRVFTVHTTLEQLKAIGFFDTTDWRSYFRNKKGATDPAIVQVVHTLAAPIAKDFYTTALLDTKGPSRVVTLATENINLLVQDTFEWIDTILTTYSDEELDALLNSL